jgi:hypothetical protein
MTTNTHEETKKQQPNREEVALQGINGKNEANHCNSHGKIPTIFKKTKTLRMSGGT